MRLILCLLLSLAASPALAGQRAVYAEPDGKTLTVEVADNGFARVTADADQYGIWRDRNFYIVGREDGRLTVARIEDVAAAIDQVVPPIFKAMFQAAGAGQRPHRAEGRPAGRRTRGRRLRGLWHRPGQAQGEHRLRDEQ